MRPRDAGRQSRNSREDACCISAIHAVLNRAPVDGLTLEEIDLMWKTAPPRMPIPPPQNE